MYAVNRLRTATMITSATVLSLESDGVAVHRKRGPGGAGAELDEAALVDGASHLQMLVRIFLPVAVPGLIAATIFAFTASWSGFLYPLAFIFSSDQQVLTAGTVTSLIKGDVYHWGGLMAGAVLACLPPVLLYVFLMDYYISGLTAGSTKA